jgi:hypothetical protein
MLSANGRKKNPWSHDLTLIKERSDREENLRWESKQEVRRTEER